VSTDDAYINGHVTFVAPRVTGQVTRVLVDDNYRVSKGDLLVELDREPYEVQVSIKKAAVETAEADLGAAEARAHALVGQARSSRFNLDHTIESVRNQLATLRSNVAQLKVEEANLQLAERDCFRISELIQRKYFVFKPTLKQGYRPILQTPHEVRAAVEQAMNDQAVIFYTLISEDIREALHRTAEKHLVPSVDLLGTCSRPSQVS
jgi:multidrug resistance efflux pump